MDDDFLLDEDDDLENSDSYVGGDDQNEDDSLDEGDSSSGDDSGGVDEDLLDDDVIVEDDSKPNTEADASAYNNKMTSKEVWLSSAYNDIMNAASKDKDKVSVGGAGVFDGYIMDAVRSAIMANPVNTSMTTVEFVTHEFFNAQGHQRIVSTLYSPEPMRSDDIDDKLGMDGDFSFNQKYSNELRNQIARFIEFLATRDLSKDSIISKRRKQRQIPAFIIFLFSSGLYDLIIDCPTMPPEYDEQIKKAMERISKAKDVIVESLAARYEEHHRPKVAERVRKLGTAWFDREPAEIRTLSEYADLGLTQQDIVDYREFRSKFTNVSKSLTQDTISDMIEVVLDKDAGIYERLKDKTRSDAITDVKQVFKEWSKNNPADTELAEHIIWNDIKK
jgi:hypothetical protein